MAYERESIRALKGYIAGKQVFDRPVVKLNANENPYPPAQAVERELAAITARELRQYPPATADAFRSVAAQIHGVSVDEVMAVNGGDELLRLVVATFVEPGAVIATTKPAYALYSVLAALNGSSLCEIPIAADGWRFPDGAAELANDNRAALALISNPHAPSGVLFSAESVASFVSRFNGVALVDEAYVDFVSPALRHDLVPLLRDLENLVLLRTLSKGYSLAGLRFGYALASSGLIRPMMEKTRDSYNVDSISQRLAMAALRSRHEIEPNLHTIRMERERMRRALLGRSFVVPPSEANFLLVDMPEGRTQAIQIKERLESRGVLIRHFDEPGIDSMLRITIGLAAQNDLVLAAF